MPISIILDVATGLVFLFFLLALIASSIQELIAGVFAWRGTYLSRAIDVILDNDRSATFRWYGLGDFLKAHFTKGTGQTALQRLPDAPAAGEPKGNQILRKLLAIQNHPLLSNNPGTLPAYIPARNFALALMQILRDGSQAADIAAIRATVATLPDGDLKEILSAFLVNAGNDIDLFRQDVERWFDQSMARLSGIYSRLSRYMMLILGVVLALVLNVDSIHIARALWETPSMRAAVIASASNANTFGPPTPAATQGAQASTPPPAATGSAKTDADAAATDTHTLDDAWSDVQKLEDAHVPLGWDFSKVKSVSSFFSAIAGEMTPRAIPGWIITAVAIGFGAPFWFGLLQNLANMRSSGPPPTLTPPTS